MRTIIKDLFWYLPYEYRRKIFRNLYPDKNKRYEAKLSGIDYNGTSFQGFIQYKTIFVHIPKSAGLSVNKALFGNNGGGHIPLKNYQLIFDRDTFSSYFKFTIVRNPWDRLYSAYSFLNESGITQVDKIFADTYVKPYNSFDDFVGGFVTTKNIYKGIHFIPQYKFLVDTHGNLLTDYIGKFENLENEFESICGRLGINATLSKTNKSNRSVDYRQFYSQESRDIVASVYGRDIELFSYEY